MIHDNECMGIIPLIVYSFDLIITFFKNFLELSQFNGIGWSSRQLVPYDTVTSVYTSIIYFVHFTGS